jgi:hypothetical protein
MFYYANKAERRNIMSKIEHVKLMPNEEELKKFCKEKPLVASMTLPWTGFAEILVNAYIDAKNRKNEEIKET